MHVLFYMYRYICVYMCVCIPFYTHIHTQMCVYVYSARIFGRAFWRLLPFLLKIIIAGMIKEFNPIH